MTLIEQLSPGQSTRNHEARVAAAEPAPAMPDGLHDATSDARPVFPWRPLVLVLALVDAPEEWSAAVALVDDLQDLDVDARLALPSQPEVTSRWVRPARASEATLRTLRPDVVVAWDAEAVAASERWATGLRMLTVVERAGDGSEVEVVPWRIGRARGRVRGRFGADAAAAELAPLVHRLAAGPQPEAPDPTVVIGGPRRPWDVVDPRVGVHHQPPRRSCAYIVGGAAAATRAAEELAGHLRRANVHVTVSGPAALAAAADADIVLLHAVAGDPAAEDLASRRASRPTVFVLDPSDVGGDGRVSADAARLLARCGRAVAPTDGGRDLVRAAVGGDVRAITVPPVMRAERYRELARAHAEGIPPPVDVIGWAPATADSPIADAIEAALAEILDTRPGARVDLVRGGSRLAGHPRVRRLTNDPRPTIAARWSLFVTADGNQPPLDLEPPVLAEVGVLGVPSLVPTGWARAPGRVLVDGSERKASWLEAITHLLDEVPTREELAYEAAASAECLQRPSAADAVVNRFLGWIDRGPRR